MGMISLVLLVDSVYLQSFSQTISNALVEVRPSITLASLSEVLAFAVGRFIPMPACCVFSMSAS